MPKVQKNEEDTIQPGPSQGSTATTTKIYNVAQPKIPPFWSEQPGAWFTIVENQYLIHRVIDDDEQFAHALGAIPQGTIPMILDILRNPPPGNKYNALKFALMDRYTISEEQRLNELLSGFQTMGDLRPSHFYRLLEQKAGDSKSVNADLLKNLWLKRLPDDLRAILARDVKKDIQELLPVADQIWVYAQSRTTSSLAEVRQQPSCSKATVDGESALVKMQKQLDQTQRQLADLQRTLANMSIGYRGRSQNRNFHNHSKSRTRSSSRSGFCHFHRRFGSRARNCSKPCSFRPVATYSEATSKFSRSSEN